MWPAMLSTLASAIVETGALFIDAPDSVSHGCVPNAGTAPGTKICTSRARNTPSGPVTATVPIAVPDLIAEKSDLTTYASFVVGDKSMVAGPVAVESVSVS